MYRVSLLMCDLCLAVASMATIGETSDADSWDAADHDRVRLDILGLTYGPTSERLIAGDGTVSAPPIFESDRSRNWGPTGWFFLSQGDTITLRRVGTHEILSKER